jgi:hypothetical protein
MGAAILMESRIDQSKLRQGVQIKHIDATTRRFAAATA